MKVQILEFRIKNPKKSFPEKSSKDSRKIISKKIREKNLGIMTFRVMEFRENIQKLIHGCFLSVVPLRLSLWRRNIEFYFCGVVFCVIKLESCYFNVLLARVVSLTSWKCTPYHYRMSFYLTFVNSRKFKKIRPFLQSRS